MKYFHLTLLLFFIPHLVSGQSIKQADSLIQRLDDEKITEIEKFEILKKISRTHPDYVVALSYAKESLQLAVEMEDPLLQARAFEEVSMNERLLGNNAKSIEATFNALKLFEELGEDSRKAASYVQLGSNAVSDNNYVQAVKYFHAARKIYEPEVKKRKYGVTIMNIGEAHRLAMKYDSAIHYFNLALELNKTLNNDIIGSYSLGNLGMVYNAIDRLPEARENLTKSIELVRALEDPYSTSVYLAELGQVNQKEGNWSEAGQKFIEAFNIAEKNRLKEQVRDISAMMVSFYKERKQYDKALKYQELFQLYQDSLVNKVNIQKVEQIKASYEIDKRETEIELLNELNDQQKRLAIGLAIGILIFITFTYLLYRSNKQKRAANILLSKQKEEIANREEEKALLLRELNHRVKNNLEMVSSLLNLQENELIGHPAEESIKAGKFRVEALSLIHQKLYHEDLHTQILLSDYIKELVTNLFYSYGAGFTPHVEADNIAVNIDVAVPLSLIINELATNSLKYAYVDVDKPEFKVILRKETDKLILEISDNGVGFEPKNDGKASSFGIKLVNLLVTQLEGDMVHKNDKGTVWILTIAD